MNRILLMLLVGFALVPACAGEDSYLATSQVASWEFIQSAGGIRIDQPRKKDDSSWVLPVVCDIAGLRTITQKPTTMHSGVVVTKMLYQITGTDISISVVINTPLGTVRTSECQEINLGDIKAGDYRVLYLEQTKVTHALGSITFK